jgi:hypothetical protein
MELRSVGKGNAIGLLGHGAADFGHAVTNTDDRGLAGSVKIAAAFGVNDPTAFTPDSDGILFAEIARK